ncbi:MAG: SBBP repeat-containing protein [Anaerolineales bacterium]|uniref:SBBP repeat-containing protein n=1 Tax=Candidatus Villigracilis proximus TaxID=3140683 RepID=UPI003135FC7C|nr:SBBP repeat-containing protein [Anaerolineales bacterium]
MKHSFKNKLFVFVALLALTFSSLGIRPAQASGAINVWAKSMGASSTEEGDDIAVDGSGNVYTTGSFTGTVDFDPGAGTADLTSAGSNDTFVSKLDSSGNFVWAKRMGGSDIDNGYAIAVDGSGNVYTTGRLRGTGDFDPGAGTTNLISAGLDDIFVSKLDANGDFVWAKRMGGSDYDYGYGIAVDGDGNVYTTGSFRGTVDFDPGAGTTNLISAGLDDIFVSKLDSSGSFVWAKRLGGSSADVAGDIAVDGSGNVYTTGYFGGTADFDPGAGTADLTPAGSNDIFVSKLDSSGNFVWAKNMGGSGSDGGNGIALDSNGYVYTAGGFWDTADFDPGAGNAELTSAGGTDIFVSKLDSNGGFVWAKNMGGASNDPMYDMAVDSSGNVYTTGFFLDTADFDPGAGTTNLTSRGGDIFISKLDNNGNFIWAESIGGADLDLGKGIAVDGSGYVYTTGSFSYTVDFDPGVGTLNLTSASGARDIFVSKLLPAFTATFDVNGGSGSMSPQEAISATALTANTFTRASYTFAGWNTAANGSGTSYADGATYPFDADVTLYAKWTSTGPTFSDVPTNHWAFSYIEKLFASGITAGCGAGIYCPDNTVTRDQMAVFLLKGMHGASYTPPAVGASTGFGDVAATHWAAAWIKQLAAEGITSGCGAGNYCPDAAVTRAEIAIFLLKAKNGSSYSPPAVGASTGFSDVAIDYWAAAFIKQLVTDGITSGCGAGVYCPDSDVTRAQMAIFLVRTFNLP